MNLGLIDELRLRLNPLVLGPGKSLSQDVKERRALKLLKATPLKSSKVSLNYRT